MVTQIFDVHMEVLIPFGFIFRHVAVYVVEDFVDGGGEGG
jgi:hypothetical protein